MAKKPARPDPGPEAPAPETSSPETVEPPTLRRLTYMRCPNCGVLMAGVADRYACTACETYVSYEP
ncbi:MULTISPECIES: hypothetical protein [unclassified Streptomyces]|uniref:hypothetical protein n=1 Tax=unclassified Streptomyces TaxID=2593676 RepID=UPI00081E19D4|nr:MULTISPECIES: hypothetical protein [unclassified Streptomyces]MYR29186.1 hypothetical protein [Streptomyces sp. SID4945]SCF44579.1 Ribosomal protein S27a [Streptomyces sp. LcepLS]